MGPKRGLLQFFMIMFCTLLWNQVEASQNDSSLNSLLYDYAFNAMHKPRTGKLYEVSLPLNLSGIKVSVLRLRTHSLWQNGANFESIEIPPKMLPRPFTRRVDFVYQDLGNWSTYYYSVPSYTFVAPVIGFLAYDSDPMNRRLTRFDVQADSSIIVRFNNVSVQQDVRMKCVRFGANQTVEFGNVGPGRSCVATNQGHFSIVVPYREDSNKRGLKWWMVGIPAGIVILVLMIVVGVRLFKWRRVRIMGRESDKSEGLGTVWIGNSRMHYASSIRTQPVLENSYVP